MKAYIFTYESNGNYFRDKINIHADNLVMAQDKFIDWLKCQDVYQHLWVLVSRLRRLLHYEIYQEFYPAL